MKQTPPQNRHPKHVLSAETVAAMHKLGLVLKAIYLEMKEDGYRMVDGKIIKLQQYEIKTQQGEPTHRID